MYTPKKHPILFLLFAVIVSSYFGIGLEESKAETRLYFSLVGGSRVEVTLDNTEPVAALQFTILGSSAVTLKELSPGLRTPNPDWAVFSHRVNDSTMNVVIVRNGTAVLPFGAGEIASLEFSLNNSTTNAFLFFDAVIVSSPNATAIRTMTETLSLRTTSQMFSLGQNYPNPFNPTTVIPYHLDRESPVHLAVYDMTGRAIRILIDQQQPAGSYSVSWNSADGSGALVPSGLYFVRLQVGSSTAVRKMLLVR